MQTPKTKAKKSRLSLITEANKQEGSDVTDWGSIAGKVVIDLVQVVASAGGAVRLGYTRDGGAYSVGIYLDDDRETFYFKPGSDIDNDLVRLTEMLRNAIGGG